MVFLLYFRTTIIENNCTDIKKTVNFHVTTVVNRFFPVICHTVTQERFFVYNCSNMKIYSLFDISAIVFNDCSSEIQQKRHLVGSSRQLVLIKALFYNGCTMS